MKTTEMVAVVVVEDEEVAVEVAVVVVEGAVVRRKIYQKVVKLHPVHHPQVLFAHILDAKEGQMVVNAVRQVKVHPANQIQEVHRLEPADRVAEGHQDQLEEVVHQDQLETIIHQSQLEIKIQHDGTKGLNKLKLYARH
jgi:hypothetical protein